MRKRQRSRRGVTLIEMLVVVVIIGLFLAVVAPRVLGRADQARVTATKVQIANFQGALAQYKLDLGTFPTTEQGLLALREKNYLAKDVPVDPWGRAYVYKFPGEHGDEPDIVSLGADGQPGGEGLNADVMSWK